ncbi:LysE family translocator [Pannonibacter indicus]|uniref:Threonine/homoserine/homoserine lactone efflux protein n=1 Tax=Pannonibacter indicus TaxID=466044 RepID=A0A0K6IC97_9HYPH|nr:LysE family translocator [Pannonibacter indicus]CUB00731.1 Threonine/homoserine/homoserine lactone efflux protein [Pannonibacter indicus]
MTPDLIAAFVLYAFVSSITPGPNNTMLLASGVNFGLRASLPHILGINIGFSILVLSCGLGIGALFELWPALHDVLKYAGALYMAWLAWKIARSGAPQTAGAKPKPFTFLQAAAFQWINPKAWIMAIGAIAAYTPADGFFTNVLIITLLYSLTGGPSSLAWAAAGTLLRGFLSNPKRLQVFNIAMALLLLASLYPVMIDAAQGIGLMLH